MSYILEALNKSQKERELGQVPTLADAPYLAADKPGRGAYWGIVAVALAVLATLIALYAAFGQHFFPAEGPSPSMPATTGAAAAPDPGPDTPAPAPAAAAPKVADSRSSEPQPAEPPKPARAPAAPAAPAVSTVLPDSGQRPESHPAPTPAPVKPVKPAAPPARTVVNKPAVAVPREPGLRLPPDTPEVPPELVREVQRFKEQVRQEQSKNTRQAGKPASAAPPAAPPTPVAPRPEPATTEEPAGKVEAPPTPRRPRTPPPNLSDLPAPVQQTIPEYRLTVHVYSSTPEQRFVIINSRKMREGDRSRKGLRLEEITPDGAMLEYQGQRFFHHR